MIAGCDFCRYAYEFKWDGIRAIAWVLYCAVVNAREILKRPVRI